MTLLADDGAINDRYGVSVLRTPSSSIATSSVREVLAAPAPTSRRSSSGSRGALSRRLSIRSAMFHHLRNDAVYRGTQ